MTAGFLTTLARRRAANLLLSLVLVCSVLAPRVGLALGLLLGGETFSVVLCTGSGLVRVAVDANGTASAGLTTAFSTASDRIGSTGSDGDDPVTGDNAGTALHCAPGSTPRPALGRHLAIVEHGTALTIPVAHPDHPDTAVPRFIQPAERAPPENA